MVVSDVDAALFRQNWERFIRTNALARVSTRNDWRCRFSTHLEVVWQSPSECWISNSVQNGWLADCFFASFTWEIGIFLAQTTLYYAPQLGIISRKNKCIHFSRPAHALGKYSLFKTRAKKPEDFNVTHLPSFYLNAWSFPTIWTLAKFEKGRVTHFETRFFLPLTIGNPICIPVHRLNSDLIAFVSASFGFVGQLSTDPTIMKWRLKNASEMDRESFIPPPHFVTETGAADLVNKKARKLSAEHDYCLSPISSVWARKSNMTDGTTRATRLKWRTFFLLFK